jgi:hypothetical protein
MMSLSSSQAGIVGARRKKLNQTQFSSYRRVRVEHNRPRTFSNGILKSENSFIIRHIYNYNKTNNTFTFLGAQQGQSLIRKKTWISNIGFSGCNPAILDGTYIRDSLNSTVYWKNGIPNSDPNISFENDNLWFFNYSQAPGGIAAVLEIAGHFFSTSAVYVDTVTPNYALFSYESSTIMDNTSVKNINNNKLYSTKDADQTLPEQIFPDVNFNINTANVFDTKNLAHNEKVFVDVRWTKMNDTGDYFEDLTVITMNDRKGFIYRIGVIIKDNTIDSMLYHTDLATDSALIRQLQANKSFSPLLA